MPERVSPHVKLVFAELARQQRTYDELEAASGVRRPTVKQWRRKNAPSLDSLEAVLNALGWQFIAVPAHVEMLPPSVAAKAAELAALAKIELGKVWSAAVQIAALQLASTAEGERILATFDAERAAANGNSPRYRRKSKPANDNAKQAESAA
jgi:transcriptional regulator with XRE-family HTH domain